MKQLKTLNLTSIRTSEMIRGCDDGDTRQRLSEMRQAIDNIMMSHKDILSIDEHRVLHLLSL